MDWLSELWRKIKGLFRFLWSDTPEVAPTRADFSPERMRQGELPDEAMPEVPPNYEQRRDGLFSYRERVFYRALLEVVDPRYQIFAKVRMGDLVWLSNEVKDRKLHNSQIMCKHLDFVVCDKGWLKPALVIELDDSSHSRYDRRESDAFKDRVFQAVGLPLLRVPVQQAYPREELKAQIEEKLGLNREPVEGVQA